MTMLTLAGILSTYLRAEDLKQKNYLHHRGLSRYQWRRKIDNKGGPYSYIRILSYEISFEIYCFQDM